MTDSRREKLAKTLKEPGFIYFIECQHEPYPTKIGSSKDPDKRISELRVSCPYTLQIRHTIKATTLSTARRVEKYIHKLFREWWMRGEWYIGQELDYGKLQHLSNEDWVLEWPDFEN